MSTADNRLMRRRLANAYLSSVISISLVLLLVYFRFQTEFPDRFAEYIIKYMG